MKPDAVARKYLVRIESELKRCVATITPASLREPIAHVVAAGGKRLRPLITMFSCAASGGAATDALDAAVAVELLHTFTLVHDDIMDNSATRRGRQTVHTRWDANRAILAGDTIAALAAQSLARRDHPRSARIARAFAEGFVDVCKGQALDKEFESRTAVTMKQYLNMIDLKTAALFGMSAAIGGAIGTHDPLRIAALFHFGRELGLAFQIRDDALDIGADPKKFGKDHGGDIREGKKTFLYVAACGIASRRQDVALLRRYSTERGLRGGDAKLVQRLYLGDGAVALAETEIHKRTTRAIAALHALPLSPARNKLEALALTLTGRTF